MATPPRTQVTPPSELEWINGATAARLAGCHAMALPRAALLGLIRVRILPGIAPRYHKDDCERLGKDRTMVFSTPAPRRRRKPAAAAT
jgi:hypothetical protein